MEEREIRSRATQLPFFHTAPLICAIFAVCVCKVFAVMDREWMYKTSRLKQAYLDHVIKFIAVAKRHRLSLKWEHMLYPCKSYKNLLANGDDTVKSHLVWYGFVKDYTATVNVEHQTSSAAAGGHGNVATSHNADRDYITMDDLLQDTADDDGGGGSDDGDGGEPVRDPETAKLFESITNRLDHDDVLFESSRWLENFREMKQAVIDPLYKDYPKHWTALCFNLQMLMLKARYG